ncbi:assimilatory nitrate reductase catalytic subunit [Marisediminicola sp. UYEF4]|uniref:molybdopterin oxidoreductase family protein n=1 Tax=Marisediminicola sp. UYEF4 TaxID=1756384 RepID=UPI0033986EAA
MSMATVGGTASHCPYCALQCAMTLTPSHPTGGVSTPAAPGGRPLLAVSGREFPTNRGGLCTKGWTAAELIASPERILEPMVRRPDGTFAAASWADALDLVAARLATTRVEHGADAVGVFGGGGLTNEKAYQLGKFARIALGTSRIDYNGRFCMSSAAAAGNRAFGVDRGLPFRVEDLDAADTILILGSNVAETMPPFIAHLEGARAAGGLLVVDPRRSATARLTDDGAGLHVQPTPGSDLVLLLGLINIVISEGLVDAPYIESRTVGFDALRRSVSQWWPERVQSQTGVPAWHLRDIARRLARGRGTYILTGRGVEQHVDGTDTATAAINLALVLGLVGTADSGYGTLTGQGNGQGGREHGQKCDQLPGYRRITDPAGRAHVASVWGVDADSIPGPGLPAVEMLAELGGSIRCLLVHGSNIVVSAPDAGRVRAGVEALDFLVVCDFFFSETAALADVVLPVTQWAEEEGTMTSLEGRVIRRRRALDPPPGVRGELWIMRELARRLGSTSSFSDDAETVFEELCRASAGGMADYSGIRWSALDAGEEAYWPYPAGSAGTPRLFLDRFAHPDGLARLVAVRARSVIEPAQLDGTLTLITGRLLEHYQSGAQTRRVPELAAARPDARVQLHPATAARLGIGDGDEVDLSNLRGTVRCRAEVTTGIRHDTVFLPFHFAGRQCANLLTEGATDPVSGMPEFKKTTVRLVAVGKESIRA